MDRGGRPALSLCTGSCRGAIDQLFPIGSAGAAQAGAQRARQTR
jgi:hypothetical protein